MGTQKMPAAFIGHGNSMNALQSNRYTAAWRAFGESVPRPRAILGHTDFTKAVPTPDHFLPLLYLAGLADSAEQPTELLIDGYAAGSISMAAYTLGLSCPGAANAGAGPAALLPDQVPTDGTNL